MTVRQSAAALLLAAAAGACGGGSDGARPPGPTVPAATPTPVAAVASVTLAGAPESLVVAGTAQLVATARDASGNPLQGVGFTWAVSDPALARVSSNGAVTARGPGAVEVTASYAGISGAARIRLAARPPLALLTCGGVGVPGEVRRTADVAFAYGANGARRGTVHLYAPPAGTQRAPCPGLVLMPAGCNQRATVDWAGPLLAAQGYVVATMTVAVPPNGNTAVEECAAAASGVLDLLLSDANPYRRDLDPARLGGVGYSHAARVWVGVQDEDLRLRAIVAWDNLPKGTDADQGSPSCAPDPGTSRTPRVPALGIASEERCEVTMVGPNAKQTGYAHWRAAGVPAMSVVPAASLHGDFGSADSPRTPLILYYTRNWFDRWLKGDPDATARLLADRVQADPAAPARSRADLLSTVWRSAAFVDGRDCPDLRGRCP